MLKTNLKKGILLDIFIAERSGPFPPPQGGYPEVKDCISVNQVKAIKGRGLEGDRWFDVNKYRLHSGELANFNSARQISLISSEEIEKINLEGYNIDPIKLRRNLLCKGVDLNSLLNKKFRVGNVYMRGVQLCQPCKHIETYNNKSGLIKALLNKGGLRAEILNDGILTKGDEICWHG